MSSGISGTPQHGFLSTHNALHIGGDDDDKIHIHVSELDGDRQTALSVFPFYDVEVGMPVNRRTVPIPVSSDGQTSHHQEAFITTVNEYY